MRGAFLVLLTAPAGPQFVVSATRNALSWGAPQTGQRSHPDLVVPRLRPGGVSCHHPNHLFTRVSSARLCAERWTDTAAPALNQVNCLAYLSPRITGWSWTTTPTQTKQEVRGGLNESPCGRGHLTPTSRFRGHSLARSVRASSERGGEGPEFFGHGGVRPGQRSAPHQSRPHPDSSEADA